MSQLFARVELLGSPSEEIYNKLHAHMESLNWYRKINGKDLPHATYQATYTVDAPGLMDVSNGLKAAIEQKIWAKALVLVIRSADWAKSAAG